MSNATRYENASACMLRRFLFMHGKKKKSIINVGLVKIFNPLAYATSLQRPCLLYTWVAMTDKIRAHMPSEFPHHPTFCDTITRVCFVRGAFFQDFVFRGLITGLTRKTPYPGIPFSSKVDGSPKA